MIERYKDKDLAGIWSDERKLDLWQRTELAVIQAMANLGKAPNEIYEEISGILTQTPIDLDWWLQRDREIRHDLNVFLDERLRFLPHEFQLYSHKKITFYDTEEPAFATVLQLTIAVMN